MNSEEVKIANFWRAQFEKYLDVANSYLLEIGCGEGKLGPILSDNVVKSYFGIDPDSNMIKVAKKNSIKGKISYKVGRAEKIPFKNKFNILFYTNSRHFIEDFDKALKEAKRVLHEKGIVVILEPSEKTTNWGSPLLRRESPQFSEEQYLLKLKALEKARQVIYQQKPFKIVSERIGNADIPNLWILK